MTSGMTSALTPALSPRRGRIIRRVLGYATGWGIARLATNDTESVTAIRIEELSSAVPLLTLSPGERAGVRASVNAHSTENIEEPKIE
jgi:hypothetical protein